MVRTWTVRRFGTRKTTAELAAKQLPPVDHTQEVALQAQRQGLPEAVMLGLMGGSKDHQARG